MTLEAFDELLRDMEDFWPKNADHMRTILDSFWFHEFHDTFWGAFETGQRARLVSVNLSFVSQVAPSRAYCLYCATRLRWRKSGIGQALYRRQFRDLHRRGVQSIATTIRPDNGPSLRLHLGLGFRPWSRGLEFVIIDDGIQAVKDYRGPGKHRVVLRRRITAADLK